MTGAQFEISIDGVPRTYRDQKDLALLAAQILKSRNPNSVIKVKDLKTGKETVIRSRRRNNNGMLTLPNSSLDWLKFESFDLFLRRARQCRCRSTPAPRDVIAPLDLGLTAPKPLKTQPSVAFVSSSVSRSAEARWCAGMPEAAARFSWMTPR